MDHGRPIRVPAKCLPVVERMIDLVYPQSDSADIVIDYRNDPKS